MSPLQPGTASTRVLYLHTIYLHSMWGLVMTVGMTSVVTAAEPDVHVCGHARSPADTHSHMNVELTHVGFLFEK